MEYLHRALNSSILLFRERTFPHITEGRNGRNFRLYSFTFAPPFLPLFLCLIKEISTEGGGS